MSLLGSLVIILVSTTFFNHLFARMSLPGVLGQLIAGIVIGPAILSFVHPSENLTEFAEIGVILLMFMAGIESNLDQLKKIFKACISSCFSRSNFTSVNYGRNKFFYLVIIFKRLCLLV